MQNQDVVKCAAIDYNFIWVISGWHTRKKQDIFRKNGNVLIRRETWRLDYVTATKSQSAEICSTMRM